MMRYAVEMTSRHTGGVSYGRPMTARTPGLPNTPNLEFAKTYTTYAGAMGYARRWVNNNYNARIVDAATGLPVR